jgi:hypothetical protein
MFIKFWSEKLKAGDIFWRLPMDWRMDLRELRFGLDLTVLRHGQTAEFLDSVRAVYFKPS